MFNELLIKKIFMSFLSQLERFEHMHKLIELKATGNPQQFADRVKVSESTLYYYIGLLKERGAKIAYSRYSESYYYKETFSIQFGV